MNPSVACEGLAAAAFRRRRKVAFTLVELLTVMAIIGMLAALLVPAFAAMRTKARATRTRNEVRQIDMACKGFMMDRRQSPSGASGNQLDAPAFWTNLIPTYIETTNIMYGVTNSGYLVPVDGWGQYYRGQFNDNPSAANERSVKIWSIGPDGKDGGPSGNSPDGRDDVRSW